MSGITLWVPSADSSARWPCITSWWNLETPGNQKLHLYHSGANNVRYSWNKAVQDFLATKDEWLLSWHSDVVGDPKTLLRLLSWGRPLVSALTFMRTMPYTPHIWQAYKDDPKTYSQRVRDTRVWFQHHKDSIGEFGPFVMDPRPDDALVSVHMTSTSCMLIHRAVLEDMRERVNDIWFQWDDDYEGGGEDRRFCQYARAVGYETFVDRSCVVGHLTGDNPASAAEFFGWDYITKHRNMGPREIVR